MYFINWKLFLKCVYFDQFGVTGLGRLTFFRVYVLICLNILRYLSIVRAIMWWFTIIQDFIDYCWTSEPDLDYLSGIIPDLHGHTQVLSFMSLRLSGVSKHLHVLF